MLSSNISAFQPKLSMSFGIIDSELLFPIGIAPLFQLCPKASGARLLAFMDQEKFP